MSPRKPLLSALAIVALSTFFAPEAAAGEGWLTDYEAAKKKARAEGKDLLIDFTGSDWCTWCIRLRKEVFEHEAFREEAPKHFVLVELDYPKRKRLDAKTEAQNDALKRRFNIRGFPTVYLTDAEGRPYAKTGYRRGGVHEYLEHLAQERQKREARDRLFAKGRDKGGPEGARLLDQALTLLQQSSLLIGYESIYDEIVALDADDAAGLRSKYLVQAGLAEISDLLAKGEADSALTAVDRILPLAKRPSDQQLVLYYKAAALLRKGRKDEGLAALEEAIRVAPRTQYAATLRRTLAKIKTGSADDN